MRILKYKNPVYFDRAIAHGNIIWFVLVIMFIFPLITYGIGALSKYVMEENGYVHTSSGGLFWQTMEWFVNPNSPDCNTDPAKRTYLLLVGILGVFLLNGLLVSMLVSWVDNRTKKWQEGNLHYDTRNMFSKNALRNYVIIIGGNEIVPNLAKQLLKPRNGHETIDFILIMTNRDILLLRKKLISSLGSDEEKIVIYHGERTSIMDLSRLQIDKAKEIYVIGEQMDIDQKGSHHDIKNMECIRLMSNLLNEKKQKTCRVMFDYQSSFSVFQFTDVNETISKVIDFKPFNYYETWARRTLVCSKTNVVKGENYYLPLEGDKPITYEDNDTVHIVIVGMSRMGIALGIEAAHLAHYPNFVRDPNMRTKITFIDSNAKKEMHFFQGHYKELFSLSRWRYIEYQDRMCNEFLDKLPVLSYEHPDLEKEIVDIEWEFIQGDLEMPAIQEYIRMSSQEKNKRLTIAICFPEDNQSFAASLYLPDTVYEGIDNNVVQVLAYQPYGDAMCQSFLNANDNRPNLFNKLRAFGMISSCYDIEMQERIERMANEIYTQYKNTGSGKLGDRNKMRKTFGMTVHKAGKSLAANKWSNDYAASHSWTKLRSIKWEKGKLSEHDISLLAKVEHNRWNMEQLLLCFAQLTNEELENILGFRGSPCPIEEFDLYKRTPEDERKETKFPSLVKWLNEWEKFDMEKEVLKSRMSHLDICSYDELLERDKEAEEYDRACVSILPDLLEMYKEQYD